MTVAILPEGAPTHFGQFECVEGSSSLPCNHLDNVCWSSFVDNPTSHNPRCPWQSLLRVPAPTFIDRTEAGTPIERWEPAVDPKFLPHEMQAFPGQGKCYMKSDNNAWTCTLRQNHGGGFHIAHGFDTNKMVARWPTIYDAPPQPTFADQARRLLASDAYEGDHGFFGQQLDAWNDQRSAILDGLLTVAKGNRLERETVSNAENAQCPAQAVPPTVEVDVEEDCTCRTCGDAHINVVTREEPNEDYSGRGTPEGAAWVENSKTLLRNVLNEQRGR